jgi:hypothetical protein
MIKTLNLLGRRSNGFHYKTFKSKKGIIMCLVDATSEHLEQSLQYEDYSQHCHHKIMHIFSIR